MLLKDEKKKEKKKANIKGDKCWYGKILTIYLKTVTSQVLEVERLEAIVTYS